MRINTNTMAFNAYRNLNTTNDMLSKSLEKLSSGYRINRAADDASGLVISQNLDKQVSGLRQATQNAQDGISVVQTAEGALTQVNSMLNRMHDLIVQAANTASSDSTARQAAQNEIEQLRDEIDRIGNTTSFGAQNLLDGSFGAQAAKVSGVGTGLASGVTTTATSTSAGFSLHIDSGNTNGSLHVSVWVAPATYATASSFQAAVQDAIDAAETGIDGFTGAVTVKVTDLGSGVWTTEFKRNSSENDTTVSVTSIGAEVAGVLGASG